MNRDIHYLASLIEKNIANKQYLITNVSDLSLFRSDNITTPTSGAYEPSICLIAQGAKKVQLGEESFIYNSNNYLFSGLHLPVIAQIIDASPQKPYLGLKLNINYNEISRIILENQLPSSNKKTLIQGMAVSSLKENITDAFCRLVELLSNENDIPILAPLIKREIYYRLLMDEMGPNLRKIVNESSESNQILRAILWLKTNFDKPLKVENLARIAGMSTSGFHKYFKLITSITPIQYQKQIRLQEARRLIIFENMDVATASFKVGYESQSQFSREYNRLFGLQPSRDKLKMKVTLEN